MPIVGAKSLALAKSSRHEKTNRDAIKTCAVFSLSTMSAVKLTGDTQESNDANFNQGSSGG